MIVFTLISIRYRKLTIEIFNWMINYLIIYWQTNIPILVPIFQILHAHQQGNQQGLSKQASNKLSTPVKKNRDSRASFSSRSEFQSPVLGKTGTASRPPTRHPSFTQGGLPSFS